MTPLRHRRTIRSVDLVIAFTLGLGLLFGLGARSRSLGAEPAAPAIEIPKPIAGEAGGTATLERIRRDVELLCSPKFEGRAGAGAERAADWLIEQCEAIGLEPLFDGGFEQPFSFLTFEGRNIGGYLAGSDPERADEWVVVSAHYDHLGIRDGRLYPGADDNASGVAMVLEVARRLAARAPEDRPDRAVMFVFFGQEETGLIGSRHFANHPPRPLEDLALFMTADMIGRSLCDVCGSHLFVMGTEHAPEIRSWVREAAEGLPIEVGIVGTELLVIDRSDYGPFRARRRPYLFLSAGESRVYHSPADVPETLDYGKIVATSEFVDRLVDRVANAPQRPEWTDEIEPWLGEARTIGEIFEILVEHQERLDVPGLQARMMKNVVERIQTILEEGKITEAQRTAILRVAQLVLLTIM